MVKDFLMVRSEKRQFSSKGMKDRLISCCYRGHRIEFSQGFYLKRRVLWPGEKMQWMYVKF